MADFRDWIGRRKVEVDVLSADRLTGLAGLLDHPSPDPGREEAPPLAHWLCFRPQPRRSEVGRDGHPLRGDFLPPVSQPRRMWAGGRLIFHHPLARDATLTRTSTILDVREKSGRTGDLLFVTVRHEIECAGLLAVTEEQDLVFRDDPKPSPAPATARPSAPAELEASATRVVTVDPVTLFRFSALTLNGHRIHYDRTYAQDVEGYSGLVVHGPLLATLLMDFFLDATGGRCAPSKFAFRGMKPVLDTAAFTLCLNQNGKRADLWVADAEGDTAFSATVDIP